MVLSLRGFGFAAALADGERLPRCNKLISQETDISQAYKRKLEVVGRGFGFVSRRI